MTITIFIKEKKSKVKTKANYFKFNDSHEFIIQDSTVMLFTFLLGRLKHS